MNKIELSQLQKDILSFLGISDFGKNFYWTGGTLLAYLYFSHRLSVDLDFFSDDLFGNDKYLEFVNNLKKKIGIEKITEVIKENRRIYILEKRKESVKLEFVFFPFPAVEERKKLEKFSLTVDSLVDIMANKTLSIYQRNEPKDVYDLYFYLKNKREYNLAELIGLVEKKFGVAIEEILLLEKVNRLADNIKIIKPFLLDNNKNLEKDVKNFFQNLFNDLAKRKLEQ